MKRERIARLNESPCFGCNAKGYCEARIKADSRLGDIKTMVFGDKNFDRKDCPIWIAFNCPIMVEEEE